LIYEKARYLLGGDRYLLVELGDEVNIFLNLKTIAFDEEIKKANIPSIIETAPCFRSTLIHYDNLALPTDELIVKMREIEERVPSIEEIDLQSRLIEIPVLYDDRWSRECTEHYSRTIKPIEPNCDTVIKFNNLKDLNDLIETHSTPQHWAAMIGFIPGETCVICLDPRCEIRAPKYNPPRTWTYEGTLGLGSMDTCIYSIRSVGGYQMIGRTPVKIYDPKRSHPAFKESPALLRVGDRLKFVPIDEEEFLKIQKDVEERVYRYKIDTREVFSVKKYKNFLTDVQRETEKVRKKRPWAVKNV